MSNLNLEPKHNQAIRQEIGERLRLLLSKGQAEVPQRLRELVHGFGDDGEPPFRNPRSPEKSPSRERVGGLKSLGAWLVRRGAHWG
jgi:transposase